MPFVVLLFDLESPPPSYHVLGLYSGLVDLVHLGVDPLLLEVAGQHLAFHRAYALDDTHVLLFLLFIGSN